jgi:type VI secretion system protein ImpK
MSERPMNERLYRVCADVLVTAVQLTVDSSLAAGDLRQRLIGSLERMVSDGRRMGVADADLAEARYALVAFIDEQIMRSDWAGRADWMTRPLQLELYRENTAGENFFVRLRSLLRAGDRPVAIEIYYLCLVLGFQGAYRDGGEPQAVEKFTRAARDQLRKVLPDPAKVSPHAKPKGSTRSVKTGWGPLIVIAASSAALIVIVVVGLGWAASSEQNELVEQLARRDARAASSLQRSNAAPNGVRERSPVERSPIERDPAERRAAEGGASERNSADRYADEPGAGERNPPERSPAERRRPKRDVAQTRFAEP